MNAVPGFHVCEHCDEPVAVDSDTCPNCMYTYDDDDDDALVPCPICGGNGQDDWEPWMPCEHCDGMGYEWWR